MSPFVVNDETKRRIMTEVIMVNEKHVMSCLLAKNPLCSTLLKKIITKRETCDGVLEHEILLMDRVDVG
jgi:hypothetical protein